MWSSYLSVLTAAVAFLATPAFSHPTLWKYANTSTIQTRQVFAHFMVGLTSGYTATDWTNDISAAKAAGIDGFAMNIGPQDSWTQTQLDSAYGVATTLGLRMFISFDMACCGPWDVNTVVSLINRYKAMPAQFSINGVPFVSTFEGTDWISNWSTVRTQTGGIYLVPNWTSLGPTGFANYIGQVDGAFSWDAWPNGPNPETTSPDNAWKSVLGSKTYMAPVSPWFYTNLPQFNKNWLWKGDDLWFTRWEEMLTVLPNYIEIISWNDFGESHYIGPITEKSIVSGANVYVDNMSHDGFRFILPYFIAAYKAGTSNIPVPQEGFSFWYRLTPVDICSAGGTTCNNPAYQTSFAPDQCLADSVFVVALTNTNAEVAVSIGGQSSGTTSVTPGATFINVPFNGRQGAVVVTLSKAGVQVASATGANIVDACPPSGVVNFNAWAGKATV